MPPALSQVGEWAPVALLVVVGTWNLWALLQHEAPGGPRAWAIRWLGVGARPGAVLLVGFVFGLAFDTASQAAAWGSAAAVGGGLLHALAVGAVFTAGMALTDTVDGQLMGALAANGRTAYRRTLGWFTVVLAFAVAASVVAEHVAPGFAPNGAAVGAGLVALLAGAWAMGRAPAPGSGTRASG